MYDGTAYQGWQRLGQEQRLHTIQGILEEVLRQVYDNRLTEHGSTALQKKYKLMEESIIGSSRTDAGVHAYGQVANFYMPSAFALQEIKAEMNALLPEDIKVISLEEAAKDFHSRYDAKSKIYEYYIDTRERQGVFQRRYCLHFTEPLDIKRMQQAGEVLLGTHDFQGFSTKMRDGRSTIKTLYDIEISKKQEMICIALQGDGFLYNMVRIIVGTLLEVGTGKKSIAQVEEILQRRERSLAGPTVSSIGLFLKRVLY